VAADGSSCKRCGAALAEGIVGIGECAGCGAMYGILADSQRYVEAVFSEPERAPEPPIHGVSARWRGRFGHGPAFRSSPRSDTGGELRIDYVERKRGKDLALFAVAIGALVFVCWSFFRIGLRPWLFVPAALVAIMAYIALGRLRMRLRVQIAGGLLEYTNVRHGLLGRVVERIPVAEIGHLYVVHVPEKPGALAQFELRLRKRDGTTITFEAFLSPTLPLLLEHLLERALGIGDQPEPGELDRHVPVEPPRLIHATLAIALGLVCAITAVFVELSSGALATVALGDQPRDSEIVLLFPTTLAFDSELSFSRRDPTAGALPSVESIPRSAMFRLDFIREGQLVRSLDCDPHDLQGAELVIDEAGPRNSGYRVVGAMRCSIRLEPGRYTLRAHAEPIAAAHGAGLVGSQIEPRFKRHLY